MADLTTDCRTPAATVSTTESPAGPRDRARDRLRDGRRDLLRSLLQHGSGRRRVRRSLYATSDATDAAGSRDQRVARLWRAHGCGRPTRRRDGARSRVRRRRRRADLRPPGRAHGRAIGLDMTDEMLELARTNAAEAGVENVEFLKGYLEDIPLTDQTVDVIISNCVINLVRRQTAGLRARRRACCGPAAGSRLRRDRRPRHGRATRADMAAWTGCIAGALTETDSAARCTRAGFERIEIPETHRVHEHAGSAIIRAGRLAP